MTATKSNMQTTEKSGSFIGVDLFAGAGGMSLGAEWAGVDVVVAIENNRYAAETYRFNHPKTRVINEDIRNVDKIEIDRNGSKLIVFGGPPCKGFSTSNQRTRNSENPKNWLFKEFFRFVKMLEPDLIVFENVKGIIETEGGKFHDYVIKSMEDLDFQVSDFVLCSADYGVPQIRNRFFAIGSREGVKFEKPEKTVTRFTTVKEVFEDLPDLPNGASVSRMPYKKPADSEIARKLRGKKRVSENHLVTRNTPEIIERYKFIPQGGNWRDIPEEFMSSYRDRDNCHTGIYKRLKENEPSVVIGNFRKNMLIHPWQNRGLSVREAARLQSFPDWFEFKGSIGPQQQQVGNSVPPLLSKNVFLKNTERRNF